MKKPLLLFAAVVMITFCTQSFAQRYLQPNFINDITITKDITYAQNYSVLTGAPVLIDLKMDVYSPDGDPHSLLRPMIIYIHTGSFLPRYINGQPTGSKEDSTVVEMCTQFAKRGYVAVAMTYRTGWNPAALGPDGQDIRTGTLLNAVYRAIQDTKACVRYFKKDAAMNNNVYQVDTTNIVLCGQGSGGYVALAYATLDKSEEIALPKFLSNTTNAQYGFVAGMPYVNQAVLGDFEGTGGLAQYNSTSTINLGYTTRVKMVFNMGGALGDSSWMEAGDVPMAAMHVTTDPFAPYGYGQVIVPATQDFVVNVSGSHDAIRRANNLGNNTLLNSMTFNDPYTTKANQLNEGIKNLFPVVLTPALQAAPWEWWDSTYVKSLPASPQTGNNTGLVINANGKATNPNMSKQKALGYIDTAQGFVNPRIVAVLGLSTGTNAIFSTKESVKIFPNPANGVFFVQVQNLQGKPYNLELLDALGKRVFLKENIYTESYSILRNAIPNGVYFMKVSCEKDIIIKKLILY